MSELKFAPAELERLCDALPEGFMWGDPLQAYQLREILSAMGHFDLIAAVRDLIGWVPGPAHWHTDAAQKAVDRAIAAIAKALGEKP